MTAAGGAKRLRRGSASDDLMALARARPEDRDATLLRAATALFCQEAIHDRDGIRRFEQLAIHLLPKVAEGDRAYIASLLGGRNDAPASVMRILARDAIGIAGPVLRNSPVLATVDLLGVIAATGPDHHGLIATRPDLTADVLRALAIARKNRAQAAEAEEAQIEAADPADASRSAASEDTMLQVPTRREPGLSLETFLDAPPEGRLRMLGEAAVRRQEARSALPQLRPDQLLTAAFARSDIVAAARRGDRESLVQSFSMVLGIDRKVVARMIDDPSGEPLVLMAKAAGLNDGDGRAVLLLANKEIGASVDAFFRVADLYASLERPVADAFIDAWRGGSKRKSTHVPVWIDSESRAAPAQPAAQETGRGRKADGRATG